VLPTLSGGRAGGGRGRTIEIGEKRTHSVSGGSLAERWDAHQDRLARAP
jgi:hypothetical protein